MRGPIAYYSRRELVRLEAGVAIGPAVLRRDDVRRVARDQVEGLTCDRLEDAAAAELQVPHAVEDRVQLRVRKRALVDVGRDDVIGVRGGQQRVDAAPGTDVERPSDTGTRRERVTDARGRRVDRDVVSRVVALRVAVARDE